MNIFERSNKLTQAIESAAINAFKNPESMLWILMEGIVYSVATKMPLKQSQSRSFIKSIIRERNYDLSIREDQVYQEDIKEIQSNKETQLCDYVIQEHNAERAGLHWDFRININGDGHSFVIKRMKLPPKSPERPLKAIQQPTHRPEYFDFKGKIEEGYGKGTVKIVERGQLEVLSSNNNRVDFVIYDGDYPGHYTLKRWYDNNGKFNLEGKGKATNEWALIRRADKSPPHIDRPTEKIIDTKEQFSTENYVIEEKYDGSHAVLHYDPDKYDGRNPLISRRKPKESNHSYKARGGVLHQEDNLPWIRDMRIFGVKLFGVRITHIFHAMNIKYKTINKINKIITQHKQTYFIIEVIDYSGSIFHVEVYHNGGNSVTAGILNSMPPKAQEDQKKIGRCRVILTDVREWKGESVKDTEYEKRYEKMEEFSKDSNGQVEIAKRCPDNVSHKDFHKDIIKNGGEGTVAMRKNQKYGEEINKIKGPMNTPYRKDYYIVGFTEGKGKYKGRGVGAVQYSDKKNGKPIGKVSSKLKDEDRIDMYNNPEDYKGRKITVESQYPIKKGKAVRDPQIHEINRGKEPGIKT
jgi:hypothetical protein